MKLFVIFTFLTSLSSSKSVKNALISKNQATELLHRSKRGFFGSDVHSECAKKLCDQFEEYLEGAENLYGNSATRLNPELKRGFNLHYRSNNFNGVLERKDAINKVNKFAIGELDNEQKEETDRETAKGPPQWRRENKNEQHKEESSKINSFTTDSTKIGKLTAVSNWKPKPVAEKPESKKQLNDREFAEKFMNERVYFGDEPGERFFSADLKKSSTGNGNIRVGKEDNSTNDASSLNPYFSKYWTEHHAKENYERFPYEKRMKMFKDFVGVHSDFLAVKKMRVLADAKCNSIYSITEKVLEDNELMKQLMKKGLSDGDLDQELVVSNKFSKGRRLFCRSHELGVLTRHEGTCEIWYEFDDTDIDYYKSRKGEGSDSRRVDSDEKYGTVSGLTTDFMEHQVDRAFCLWSKFANVNFRRIKPKDCRKDECWRNRSKADIKITWAKADAKYHYVDRDSDPYLNGYSRRSETINKQGFVDEQMILDDGFEKMTLAHAYPPAWTPGGDPVFGDIHLNADIDWRAMDKNLNSQAPKGYSIFHTLVHEIGHAIGLDHSTKTESIMYGRHTSKQKFNFEKPFKNIKSNSYRDIIALKMYYGNVEVFGNSTRLADECDIILDSVEYKDLPRGFRRVN